MKEREPRQEPPEAAKRQQRNSIRTTIRGLVVLYLIWLIYRMIQGYRSGASGMGLGLVVATVVGFSVAAVVIAVLSYRQWRREEDRVRSLWAEEGERERQSSMPQSGEDDHDD